MKKVFSFVLICILLLCAFTSCNSVRNDATGDSSSKPSQSSVGGSTAEKEDSEKTEIPSDLPSGTDTLTISCVDGTDGCWNIDGQTLTFSGLTADTVCSVSGEFNGQIIIDCGDDYKFELELCGVTIYSSEENPISILSGDKVTLTAKKDSKNYVYDTREALSDDDETSYSSAVYSKCDLVLGGKGELIVISSENNGIHTKKDLEVKNLSLSVTCYDNALKGNDSVTISSGTLTLISKAGDGIKTTNTDISSKGNQRGTVSVFGGTVNIYAACDGIDSAYNVDIANDAILNIYTDKYSPYSENVEKAEDVRYIRFTSNNYSYSVKYYNSDDDYKWVNATLYKTVSGGRTSYYYYSFEKLDEYETFQLFLYSVGQSQGQEDEYTVKSDYLTWNESYDTLALESRRNSLSYNWVNYTTNVSNMPGGMGGMGGPGGMSDGNSEKGDHSTKGIKSGNEINISGGTIFINSYDDSIHANSGTTLENGNVSTGNILIAGGDITLFSKDDGIHSDGTLIVSGGKIDVTGSYEGLEGTYIVIRDGDISIVSSDDGINATTTSQVGITFEGGNIYIYAGGDGIDSNSRTSYQGILFSGGNIIIISTSGGNSSIDTEQGYTFTGGSVLAICPSNGMGSESLNCKNFSSIGSKTTMNLTSGKTLTVKESGSVISQVTMPCSISALVIYLGSANAIFS